MIVAYCLYFAIISLVYFTEEPFPLVHYRRFSAVCYQQAEYPKEAMMAFTEEGSWITAEFIQSLIKNIGDSDEELGLMLTKAMKEGFNIDAVRTFQSSLYTALKGYKSHLSFQKVDSVE